MIVIFLLQATKENGKHDSKSFTMLCHGKKTIFKFESIIFGTPIRKLRLKERRKKPHTKQNRLILSRSLIALSADGNYVKR